MRKRLNAGKRKGREGTVKKANNSKRITKGEKNIEKTGKRRRRGNCKRKTDETNSKG